MIEVIYCPVELNWVWMENAHEENLMFIINTIVRILKKKKKDKGSTDLDAVGLLSGERLEGVPGKVFNTHLNI